MKGYIKLHRQLREWGWYKDANTMRVFIALLLRANYEDGEYRGEIIKAGQAVFGRKELAQELKLSDQNVTTAINHLKSTNELIIKSNNRYSVATIVNWAFYQSGEEKVNSELNSQLISNQTTTNKQLITSKNIRNKEEKENNNNLLINDHERFADIKAKLMKGAN